MTYLTVLSSLGGGVLIGLAAAILLYFNHRVAGISGIVGGLFQSWQSDSAWRLAFLIGLIMSSSLWYLMGGVIHIQLDASYGLLAISGLLVGYGTRLGNGCTSGHGICSYRSRRKRLEPLPQSPPFGTPSQPFFCRKYRKTIWPRSFLAKRKTC